jgi:PAS domain S-box-containing protein
MIPSSDDINKNFFSSLQGEELKSTSNDLLPYVFATVPDGIQVMQAIRNSKGKIIDYEYVIANDHASYFSGIKNITGKLFSELFPSEQTLLRKMAETTETGKGFETTKFSDSTEGVRWLHNKYVKFGDGILVTTVDVTDYKIQQEETKRERWRLEQAERLSNLGSFEFDIQKKELTWSAQMFRIHGLEPDSEKITLEKTAGFINRSDRNKYLKAIDEAFSGKEVTLNTRILLRNGTERLIKKAVVPVLDAEGKTYRLYGFVQDITDQKADKAPGLLNKRIIEDNERFVQQVAEASPDIIYIIDLNTLQILYTNRQVALDIGYSKQRIRSMGNTLFDIMVEEDKPLMKEHLKQIQRAEDNVVMEIEYRLKDPKGGICWYRDRNMVFKRNSERLPVEKIGISQNISDQKKKDEEKIIDLALLRQQEELSRLGSWEYTIDSKKFKWSPGMYQLFGIETRISVQPEIYNQFAHDSNKKEVSEMVELITKKFQPFETTIKIITPEGERVLRIKAAVINDKKSRPVKVIGVDHDITDQLSANETIRDLNKRLILQNNNLEILNTEIRTFNSLAINHYNETLKQLYTNLEYIVSKDARNLTDEGKANVRRAQSAIQKLKLMTQDIISYSQLQELDSEARLTDLNKVMGAVIESLYSKIGETRATVEFEHLPDIEGQPVLLSLLFYNLIDNSIKFRKMIKDPVIKIKYSKADELNMLPEALKDKPYHIISVTDNSIGIDEQYIEKIFEMFFRIPSPNRYKGSGVGLAVCNKIMHLHNGFITAESKPSVGSTFHCFFPQ